MARPNGVSLLNFFILSPLPQLQGNGSRPLLAEGVQLRDVSQLLKQRGMPVSHAKLQHYGKQTDNKAVVPDLPARRSFNVGWDPGSIHCQIAFRNDFQLLKGNKIPILFLTTN